MYNTIVDMSKENKPKNNNVSKDRDEIYEMMHGKKAKKKPPSFLTFLLVVVAILLLLPIFSGSLEDAEKVEPTASEVAAAVKIGDVESIIVRGPEVEVLFKNEVVGVLRRDSSSPFLETLIDLGVTQEALDGITYNVEKETGPGVWLRNILPFLFPILLLLLIFWFFTRQMKGAGGMQVFQFGRARARLSHPGDGKDAITF